MTPKELERIDRAILTVAEAMVRHNLPGLMFQIKRLEAWRDRHFEELDSMSYAKELLRKGGKPVPETLQPKSSRPVGLKPKGNRQLREVDAIGYGRDLLRKTGGETIG